MRRIFSMIEGRLTATHTEIKRWNAQEFERAVFEGNPKVAVFDCDGTLWSGDSGSGFMNWTIEQGLISRSTSDWIDTRYRAYLSGAVSEVDICGEMVQMYAGLRDDEMRAAAERYVRQFIQPRIFAEMDLLVDRLDKAGVELWAVSSTNKWVVAAGVHGFRIPEERVLAAEVRIVDGLVTTEIVDVPTGEGKAVSLRRVGLTRPDAVFGNSFHDLAMLEIARHAYPVNPTPALIEAATKNGWGYFVPLAAEGTAAAVAGE